jgi:hypothetical protein
MIHFGCPSCGVALKAENDRIGKLSVCPRCRALAEVPRSLGELVCHPNAERKPPILSIIAESEGPSVIDAEYVEISRELPSQHEEQDYEEETIEPADGNRLVPFIRALGATGIVALLGILMLSPGRNTATMVLNLSQPGVTIFVDDVRRPVQNPSETSVIINELSAGQHRVVVEKWGFIPVNRPITLRANERMMISIQLEAVHPAAPKPAFRLNGRGKNRKNIQTFSCERV